MINTPLFGPGDIVYIRESAALGFLEPVQINGAIYSSNGWLYTVAARASSPMTPSHYGDRVTAVQGMVLHFSEDEFVTKCDAYLLVEANLQAQLDRIRLQRESQCSN